MRFIYEKIAIFIYKTALKFDMVYQIDAKDRKIMLCLDRNSRQSITSVSKKTHMARNIVEYRIRKLQQEKIITKFVTEVALGKIGFFTFKIYCQITGLSQDEERKMYKELVESDDFIWVAKCEGRWDLLLASYARNVIEFARVKDRFLQDYGRHVADYAIAIIDEAYVLERTYLTENERREKEELYIGGAEIVKLDNTDKLLLKIMANNARCTTVELATRVGADARTVMSRIKAMEKFGVIQGYTTFFDMKKLNFQFYKICIYLKEPDQRKYRRLVDYCKNLGYVVHLIEVIGPWELELEVEAPSNEKFQELSNGLRNNFSEIIKKVESVIISDEMKLEFLPKDF